MASLTFGGRASGRSPTPSFAGSRAQTSSSIQNPGARPRQGAKMLSPGLVELPAWLSRPRLHEIRREAFRRAKKVWSKNVNYDIIRKASRLEFVHLASVCFRWEQRAYAPAILCVSRHVPPARIARRAGASGRTASVTLPCLRSQAPSSSRTGHSKAADISGRQAWAL